MSMQKWKTDESLHSCKTKGENGQVKKVLDYREVYIREFLDADPLRDWESIERCKDLFKFCVYEFLTELQLETPESIKKWKFLDCGTKDGQMPAWVKEEYGTDALGIEISNPYIEWAQSKGRPVIYGDVCALPQVWTNKYDFVFSHHVLGLTSDYFKGLAEMFRVTKPGGYLVTLNDVPGNPKKHYSYIASTKAYDEWLKREELNPHEMLYYGDNPGMPGTTEKIMFMRKLK